MYHHFKSEMDIMIREKFNKKIKFAVCTLPDTPVTLKWIQFKKKKKNA